MEPALRRHELEDEVEGQLLEIAESLIGTAPDDLKAAKDYDPFFFGRTFPTMGISVTRAQGQSRYADKPSRPTRLIVEVKIYHPCLPNGALDRPVDDQIGPAKRITRRIRGLFLEAVFASSIGGYCDAVESRGGSRDEVGEGRTDERRQHILWIDKTELHVST